jgi:acyl-CoA thioesterase II
LADGWRVHSLHAYFLRPSMGEVPLVATVSEVRVGRTISTHRLELAQNGKQTFTAMYSVCRDTLDEPTYTYDLPPQAPLAPRTTAGMAHHIEEDGLWDTYWADATEPRADGTRVSTSRQWLRVAHPLPDDPALHAAFVGFVSDWTGIGGRPLHLLDDTRGMVSLDHAVWFHRPTRIDHWHWFDVQSTVNALGRGLTRGVLRTESGDTVMTMTQEMRLTVV